jgi:hypothetical protein
MSKTINDMDEVEKIKWDPGSFRIMRMERSQFGSSHIVILPHLVFGVNSAGLRGGVV